MRDRYIYRWGFVWRIKKPRQTVYKKDSLEPVRWRPGGIIDVDEPVGAWTSYNFKFTLLTPPHRK